MSKKSNQQDTPGRAKPSSSRQQTEPNQGTQTGSPEIDRKSKQPDPKYKDRPADEGKHGDGDQSPNSGFP